jgi:peroxiredoxin
LRDRTKDFKTAGARILVVDPHEPYRGLHFLKDPLIESITRGLSEQESSRLRGLLKSANLNPEGEELPILADSARTVSATYGVAFQLKIHTEWSNRPACFIVDRNGILRIALRSKTFDDRRTADELLEALATLKRD